MTLEEALSLLGACIAVTCTKSPGYEAVSHLLFNAVVEEWLDGSISSISPQAMDDILATYEIDAYKQAARVVANKISIYGDVK